MSTTINLDAHEATGRSQAATTYWRAGFVADGQEPVLVEVYGRSEQVAAKKAEAAAEAHYNALVDVGVFVEVKAFTQRWTTRNPGAKETYDSAAFSTSIVLRPPTNLTPADAIRRARERQATKESR